MSESFSDRGNLYQHINGKSQKVNVYESVDSFVFFMNTLKNQLKSIRRQFKILYFNYLMKLEQSQEGDKFKSFDKVDNLYKKVNKKFYNFMKAFVKDYADVLNTAIELSTLEHKYYKLVREYNASIGNLDNNQLNDLKNQLDVVINRYHTLANSYTQYVLNVWTILMYYLQRNILFYLSISGKKFVLKIDDKLRQFKRLIGTDGIGRKLRHIYNNFNLVLRNDIPRLIDASNILPITPLTPLGGASNQQPVPSSADDLNDERRSAKREASGDSVTESRIE
ncbi:conserved uncharacterized protein 35a-like protein-12 [Microplitis demolitor]|uniref:conserved uncharacterized protein 35a-like protein-12 n=1 Tax=Microplitis demolitor TaxID=69319 RepID=UPI00043FFE92|nr:conserved uncharacterized protein 35a-like protein-12 [Microplitis demolitor]KAG6558372.1 conserved uncharacterized protein 35a-like protein-12 [Microplitis demolitor]